MNNINLKKSFLVFGFVILFTLIPKDVVSGQAAPLNPGNVIRITTKNCEDSKDYAKTSGNDDRCCLKPSNACTTIFNLPKGSLELTNCSTSVNISVNSSNSCNYSYTDLNGNLSSLSGPSKDFGFDYVTSQYCAARFGVPNAQLGNYFCETPVERQVMLQVDEFGINPFKPVAAWCFGPGGASAQVFQSRRVGCCPKNENGTWVFRTENLTVVPTPQHPWTQCENAQDYLTANKISANNFTYQELTPKKVCENDSKIESKNQNESELYKQCCTCISGSTSCPDTWDKILRNDTLKNNSWTGIGCINRSQTGLATSLMRIFFGVGLVLLLLKLIVIGFDYQSGDPEKIKEARYGILAVIVSFAVGTIGLIALRFVGLDVLGLGATTDIGTLIPTLK